MGCPERVWVPWLGPCGRRGKQDLWAFSSVPLLCPAARAMWPWLLSEPAWTLLGVDCVQPVPMHCSKRGNLWNPSLVLGYRSPLSCSKFQLLPSPSPELQGPAGSPDEVHVCCVPKGVQLVGKQA